MKAAISVETRDLTCDALNLPKRFIRATINDSRVKIVALIYQTLAETPSAGLQFVPEKRRQDVGVKSRTPSSSKTRRSFYLRQFLL